MAVTKIRGNTQIMDGTILDAQISSSAAIATSKLAQGAEFIQRDGSVAFTGDLAMGGNQITGLGAPQNDNDAARRIDVDRAAQGLDVKAPVRLATTAAGTLATDFAAGEIVDGKELVEGDRILIKNQGTDSENGIYIVAATGAPSRSPDANSNSNVHPNLFCFVEDGDTLNDTAWVLITNAPINLGVSPLTFAQFAGHGTGDVNTASNFGSTGVGVFKDLNGHDLRFYKIASADAQLTVSLVSGNHIELAVVDSEIDHNALKNYDAEHHRVIDDLSVAATDLWSAQKISSELSNKRDAALLDGKIWIGNSSDLSEARSISGDISLSDTGVVAITSGCIVDGDISATAAIARSKIAAGTANHVVINGSDGKLSSEAALAVSRGGTNSGTALNNNRVMISNSGAIVEAAAITGNRALASDSNGIPVASSVLDTELAYLSGIDSNVQDQLDGKEPTISVLPIAKGGTNSSTALSNKRFIVSVGGALVEASAVTASSAVVTDADGLPTASATSATQIGYLSNVTSDVQSQLGTKLNKADILTRETPSGLLNGLNVTYQLANTPVAGSELVFLNGLLQDVGPANDYTISGDTITFNAAPSTGDKLRVCYRK